MTASHAQSETRALRLGHDKCAEPAVVRYDFDYFVIGGGSGGVRSARIAAQHGARVGIAEEQYWGGTCVNAGCVPKKLLTLAAHYPFDLKGAAAFGWDLSTGPHDWTKLIAGKDAEIERLTGIYRTLLTIAGCTMFESRAVLLDAHKIAVGSKHVTAERILIATGARPILPDYQGVGELAFTPDAAFHLKQMPRRVLVIGGGHIAMEFASIFYGLGAEVTVACRGAMVLRGFDGDLRVQLGNAMERCGIRMRLGKEVVHCQKVEKHLAVTLDTGETIEADAVLYAIGRKPNTEGIGLEAAGVACNADNAIIVDDHLCTNIANIYALGDVTDRLNLTSVAIAEGHTLAASLFGGTSWTVSYENIPTAVFSRPPIGTVGLTEEAALARLGEVAIYRSRLRTMRAGQDEMTFMKLVVNPTDDKVVGCHMMGAHVPEMLQGIAIGLNCGMTKAHMDASFGIGLIECEESVPSFSKIVRLSAPLDGAQ
jgi:glutathione reductase (NADPH)